MHSRCGKHIMTQLWGGRLHVVPLVLFTSAISHLCRNAKYTVIGDAHAQVVQLVYQFPLASVSMQHGDWCLLGSAVFCCINALCSFGFDAVEFQQLRNG